MGLFSKPKSSNDNVILAQIYCKAMNCLISDFGNGVTIALLRDGISPGNIAIKYTTYCFAKAVHSGVMNDLEKKVFINDAFFIIALLRDKGDISEKDAVYRSDLLLKVGAEENTVLGMVLSDRIMLQGDIVSIA